MSWRIPPGQYNIDDNQLWKCDTCDFERADMNDLDRDGYFDRVTVEISDEWTLQIPMAEVLRANFKTGIRTSSETMYYLIGKITSNYDDM